MSPRRAPTAAVSQPPDPFRALGLRRSADLADDEVRAAWRRAAAATHPDRADGGDPAAFAAAAVAYTRLRTPAGRAEALADDRRPAPHRFGAGWLPGPTAALAARIWRGRPGILAARVLAAAAAGIASVSAAGWQPASVAIITGALTWLTLTGRADLAPRASPREPARRWPAPGKAGEHDAR